MNLIRRTLLAVAAGLTAGDHRQRRTEAPLQQAIQLENSA